MKKIMAAFFILLMAFGLFWTLGFRINTTKSIPKGVYRIVNHPPKTGDYILFCPPEKALFHEALQRGYLNAGFCQGGTGVMMKKIAGESGDRIRINAQGVWINGKKWSQSKPLEKDGARRSLPTIFIEYRTLKQDEYLLMGEHPASFDGRYFGVIQKDSSFKTIQPIIWR